VEGNFHASPARQFKPVKSGAVVLDTRSRTPPLAFARSEAMARPRPDPPRATLPING